MAHEFKFPDVGEGIHEGTLVDWLVKPGQQIDVDQPFARVETDKAIVELPSPRKGFVQSLKFKPGDTIHVGDVMIVFGDQPDGLAPQITSETVQPSIPGRFLATPHTRSYARKLGVELKDVTPTGKNGRITDEDIDRAHERKSAPAAAAAPKVSSPETFADKTPIPSPVIQSKSVEIPDEELVERVPASNLRKLIAQNMRSSKQISAHVTHVDEADATALFNLYLRVKSQVENAGGKFTVLPLFIKAAIAALKRYPIMNASYDEPAGTIIYKKYFHIGFAADTPDGLMVPVIKNADKKDMIELAAELADLAARARERRLSVNELRGSTFTITNVGAIGGLFATPIIPQPQLAILGLHAIKDRPAVFEGQIAIRKMMHLSVSFDHRIIDGAVAARFMTELVSLIQNPDLLMMRML